MHHVDVHVSDIAAAKKLFDAVAPAIGYEVRSSDDDYVSYWQNGKRPSVGFILDRKTGSAMMQLAFGAASIEHVDRAAAAAKEHGARNVDGPSFHPEYGDDYYAAFFEDGDGNKFEICRPEASA